MTARKIITALLLLFVIASLGVVVAREAGWLEERAAFAPEAPAPVAETAALEIAAAEAASDAAVDATPTDRLIVYYFHGNVRCQTCRAIEAQTKRVLDADFAGALESGRLEWRTVNVDEPENAGYVDEFQLATRTVVLADTCGGEALDFAKLDDVWLLVWNEEKFHAYVRDAITARLGS